MNGPIHCCRFCGRDTRDRSQVCRTCYGKGQRYQVRDNPLELSETELDLATDGPLKREPKELGDTE